MGRIPNGILGTLKGRVGPVTGYTRYGVNIIRKANTNHDGKATPGRIIQREKLKICSEFARAFTGTGFLNKSFPPYGHTGSGYNRAISNLLSRAIAGTYPNQYLQWEDVMISRGPIPGVENLNSATDGYGNILFTWTNNDDTGTARGSDRMIAVAYCIDLKQAVFTLEGSPRESQNGLLYASDFTGYKVATYVSFINETGDVADSVFGGMVVV